MITALCTVRIACAPLAPFALCCHTALSQPSQKYDACLRNNESMKNPHAVALAKLRAKLLTPDQRSAIARQGGEARADSLSAAERRQLAKLAAETRWRKTRGRE
jgi:hypothetical protein